MTDPFSTKPNTANASNVMAADTPNACPESCISMSGVSGTGPPLCYGTKVSYWVTPFTKVGS